MSDWQEAEQRVERAHEYYERGRWEEALSELRQAIEINPNISAWYFNLGLTLDMMERFEEALTAYRRALEIDPLDIESLNAAGADCTRLGKFHQAIEYFEKVEKNDASYEPCYCNRIVAYSELGEHERAEEMFYLARQYREKCPVCFYNIGNSLFDRGKYDRALWCWQQVLELESEYPQVHARMAEVYWAKGQLPAARQHLIEELRADPGNLDTLLDLGELLMEMNQPAAAAEKFRQVLDLEPDECTAHFQLGILAEKENDFRLALERFKFVLRHDSRFVGAHLKIARIHHQLKNQPEAMYHANCELSQSQIDNQTLLELGNLLMDMGQIDSALTALRRLLEQDRRNADARHSLAVALLLAGRIDEGIQQCKMALRIQPKYMLAMSNLTLAYMSKHDFARARYWLAEALNIAPDDAQLRQIQHRLWLESVWYYFFRIPREIIFAIRRNK
ncbi:MAG TPA: tetratricopeptide repeat protein [Phycisphaerae bacterium]|nr:tetratricopeptide repeat protein [Phycisphaerae bacterium]